MTEMENACEHMRTSFRAPSSNAGHVHAHQTHSHYKLLLLLFFLVDSCEYGFCERAVDFDIGYAAAREHDQRAIHKEH